jgi:hypothetical protein
MWEREAYAHNLDEVMLCGLLNTTGYLISDWKVIPLVARGVLPEVMREEFGISILFFHESQVFFCFCFFDLIMLKEET